MARESLNSPRHGPDEVSKEVKRFALGLARRLCDGASMRGRASVRTAREGYRKSGSVPKWWGEYKAQVADEVESALWQHAGQMLARAGLSGPNVSAEKILRAVRSRWTTVRSLRAGERILRRMSHRDADAEETLAAKADAPILAQRWQPAADQVSTVREAIKRGARNAPAAARFLALLDAILSGKKLGGGDSARQVSRMLQSAAKGWDLSLGECPSAWRAWIGVGSGGRPATVTA